jgi:hypothetical protein
MSEDERPKIVPSQEGGVFHDLSKRVKLILRLLGDSRVHPLLKLLPIGSLVYLVIPDIAPGPIDDAAVIWLGAYLFVELCPPDVVQEHMDELDRVVTGEWREPDEDQVVDADHRDVG